MVAIKWSLSNDYSYDCNINVQSELQWFCFELQNCCLLIQKCLSNILVCVAAFTSSVQEQEQYIKDVVKTLQRVCEQQCGKYKLLFEDVKD